MWWVDKSTMLVAAENQCSWPVNESESGWNFLGGSLPQCRCARPPEYYIALCKHYVALCSTMLEERIWEQWDGLFTPENVRHYRSFLHWRLERIMENDGSYIEGRHNHWMHHVLFLPLNKVSTCHPAGHFSLVSPVSLNLSRPGAYVVLHSVFGA